MEWIDRALDIAFKAVKDNLSSAWIVLNFPFERNGKQDCDNGS